jgi:hypothetical protein
MHGARRVRRDRAQFCVFSTFLVSRFNACLPTVLPRNDDSENYVQSAEAAANNQFAQAGETNSAIAPSTMKQIPMSGTMLTENIPPVTTPVP